MLLISDAEHMYPSSGGKRYEFEKRSNLIDLRALDPFLGFFVTSHKNDLKDNKRTKNLKMERIIIFGGTGFIGQSLAHHISNKGYIPVIVARNPPKASIPYEYVQWDAVNLGTWITALEGGKALVNLAGRSVDCIKTPENKDVILRSRVDSTKVIGTALKQVANPPKTWIQMSTAHIYGDPPRQLCTESSTFGLGLAPLVGQAWEKAMLDGLPEGTREVRLRTSFVIGKNGGALASLKRIVRLGLGGKVGHGNQGISWIHEDDMNELIYQSIIDSSFSGAYIASAPNPVSNKAFMRVTEAKYENTHWLICSRMDYSSWSQVDF